MSRPPTDYTLANRQVADLVEGLRALDGYMADGKEVRFQFDTETAWEICLNAEAVGAAATVYRKATKQLAATHGVVERMPLNEKSAPQVAAFLSEKEVLDDQVQTVALFSFSRKFLQEQTKGRIAPSVLKSLRPILTDE
jgi:hypothetical protein